MYIITGILMLLDLFLELPAEHEVPVLQKLGAAVLPPRGSSIYNVRTTLFQMMFHKHQEYKF